MSQFSNSNHPLALADNSLTLDRLLRVIICCVCFASGCVVILCVNVPSRVHSSSCRRPDALGRQSPSCWFSARHDCNDKCKRYMWHLLIDYAGRALKDSLTDWSHSAALNAAGGMPAHTHTHMHVHICVPFRSYPLHINALHFNRSIAGIYPPASACCYCWLFSVGHCSNLSSALA